MKKLSVKVALLEEVLFFTSNFIIEEPSFLLILILMKKSE